MNSREDYLRVRNMMDKGQFRSAYDYLQNVEDNSAEWYYLTGMCAMEVGYYDQGEDYIKRAKFMDPSNGEYNRAFNNMSNQRNNYNYRVNQYNRSRGNNGGCCDMLCKLYMCDCCCECMGGDLIPCC